MEELKATTYLKKRCHWHCFISFAGLFLDCRTSSLAAYFMVERWYHSTLKNAVIALVLQASLPLSSFSNQSNLKILKKRAVEVKHFLSKVYFGKVDSSKHVQILKGTQRKGKISLCAQLTSAYLTHTIAIGVRGRFGTKENVPIVKLGLSFRSPSNNEMLY